VGRPSRADLRLHALGAALVVATLVLARLGPLAERVPAYLLVHLVACVPLVVLAGRWRRQIPAAFPVVAIVGWALLIRAPLLALDPSLSDDLFRYIWEGRVTAAGIDPYDFPPDHLALAHLRHGAPEWPLINHPELPAIYPPAAQWFFAAVVTLFGGTVGAMKAALVAAEAVLIAVIALLLRARGSSTTPLILYAWSPLAAVEIAASGHYEALAVLPAVAGLLAWRTGRFSAWPWWGLAFAAKYVGAGPAGFALAGLVRRGRWARAVAGLAALAATAALCALPFALDGTLPLGSLGTYAQHWGHNSSLHAVLWGWMGYHPARIACAVAFAAWGLALVVADERPARGFALAFAGLLIASPVVHPWYGLWLLALLPLWPRADLAAWLSLLPLSYLAFDVAVAGGPWRPPGWVPWVEYGVPAIMLLAARPGPAGGSRPPGAERPPQTSP